MAFHVFPLKEELVEAADEVEILVPQGTSATVDRRSCTTASVLDETVELRLVPQERMQRVGEQNVEVSIPQIRNTMNRSWTSRFRRSRSQK